MIGCKDEGHLQRRIKDYAFMSLCQRPEATRCYWQPQISCNCAPHFPSICDQTKCPFCFAFSFWSQIYSDSSRNNCSIILKHIRLLGLPFCPFLLILLRQKSLPNDTCTLWEKWLRKRSNRVRRIMRTPWFRMKCAGVIFVILSIFNIVSFFYFLIEGRFFKNKP